MGEVAESLLSGIQAAGLAFPIKCRLKRTDTRRTAALGGNDHSHLAV